MAARPAPDDLASRILRALGQTESQRMSLPRLCKQLGTGASTVMRCLSALGDQSVGGVTGPGWTVLREEDGRWIVWLTAAGQQAWEEKTSSVDAKAPDAGLR